MALSQSLGMTLLHLPFRLNCSTHSQNNMIQIKYYLTNLYILLKVCLCYTFVNGNLLLIAILVFIYFIFLIFYLYI